MPFPLRAVRGNCWDRTASRDQSRLSRRTPLTVRPSVSGAPKHTETSRKPQGAYSKQPLRLLPVIALCARSPQARDKRSSARTRVSAAASPDSPGRHVASGYPLRRVRRVPPLPMPAPAFPSFFFLFFVSRVVAVHLVGHRPTTRVGLAHSVFALGTQNRSISVDKGAIQAKKRIRGTQASVLYWGGNRYFVNRIGVPIGVLFLTS